MNLLKDNPYRISVQQIEFLEKIKDQELIMLYYLALVEGMHFGEIVNAYRSQLPAGEFKRMREKYLGKKYTDLEEVSKQVNVTVARANEAIEESQSLREVFAHNIKEIIEKQNETSKEILNAKEELIQDKVKQIELLSTANEEYKLQIVALNEKIIQCQKSVISEEKTNDESEVREKEECIDAATMPDGEVEKPENKVDDFVSEIQSYNPYSKYSVKAFLENQKRKKDANRLLELYLANNAYDDSQKTFVLDCLEEGLTLEQIEKFAMPGMNLNHMKRLKKTMYEKEGVNDHGASC